MKNIAHIEIIRENGQSVLKVWLSSDEFKEFFIPGNSSNQWDYVESDSNRFVFDGSMDWIHKNNRRDINMSFVRNPDCYNNQGATINLRKFYSDEAIEYYASSIKRGIAYIYKRFIKKMSIEINITTEEVI